MTRFACLRVWQRIRNRLPQNLWLLLRLTAGLTLLLFSIALIQNAKQTTAEERYSNNRYKRLALLERQTDYLSETALSNEDIANLSEAFPEVLFSRLIVGDLLIGDSDSFRYDRMIMADFSLAREFGQTEKPDERSLALIGNALQSAYRDSAHQAGLREIFNEGNVFLIKPGPFALNVIGLDRPDETAYEGALWLFLSKKPLPQGASARRVLSYAVFPGDMPGEKILQTASAVQLQLASAHPKLRALVLDADEKIETSAKKAAGTGQQLLFLTALVLAVVMIGLLGSYLILCDRRKPEFALLYAIGVPKRILMLEMWLENAGMFLLSWILSALIGQELLKHVHFPGLRLGVTALSLLIPLIGSVILSTVMTGFGVRAVISHSPTLSLKGS